LSASIFPDVTKADYTATPFLTTQIRSAMVNGLETFVSKLESLSDPNNTDAFDTDVPGVLQYDTFFLDGFDAPKAKKLTDILGDTGGSTLGDVIQGNIIDAINGTAIGTALSAIHFDASGHTGLLGGPHFEVHLSNTHLTNTSGDNFNVTADISIKVTDEIDTHLSSDLGRNADQFANPPTPTNPYFLPTSLPLHV